MRQRWIASGLTACLLLGLLSGCTQEVEEEPAFTLQMAMVGQAQRLDPIYATDAVEQTLLNHINDHLMTQEVDSSGVVTTTLALAKSVEETKNEDGTTTYTFTLRNAKWSDGETLSGWDFVYAWKRLANPVTNSPYSDLLSMVVGYQDVISTGDTSFLAVTAPENDLFEVTVTGDTNWFLQEVCTAIATLPVRQDVLEDLKASAPEGQTWSSDFTALVTCGPYVVTTMSDDGVTLEAYENYYGTDAKAQTIDLLYADDADTAWSWYEADQVDFIWPVPSETFTQLVEQEVYSAIGSDLETVYVSINQQDQVLQYDLVRQALFQAIDHTALTQIVGVEAQIAQGIVPAGIIEDEATLQTFRGVSAAFDSAPDTYAQRKAQASVSLAQSAYPVDAAEYALTLAYEDTNEAVAQALCQQWEDVLGIEVVPLAMEASELTQAMTQGTYQLALTSLTAIANDPEPYLRPWVSTSQDNVLGYNSSAYDTLLSIAARAEEESGRMGCLHDAEELILENYALIPLYSTQSAWLLDELLVGLTRDSRGWFSFENIFQPTL